MKSPTSRRRAPRSKVSQLAHAWAGDKSITLDELRGRRDLAAADGSRDTALACAMAIDRRRFPGLYGKTTRRSSPRAKPTAP